jgi:hypothetical protein
MCIAHFCCLDYSPSDLCLFRNAWGLAEVVTLSYSFLSSTAKAKTAKLSPAISLAAGSQVRKHSYIKVHNLLSLFSSILNSQQTQIAVIAVPQLRTLGLL